MGIKVRHGKPETLITAAQQAGAARKQEAIQKMQLEFDYRQSLRQQDVQLDLEMQERSKRWELDKMQLRSQIDFQREEQVRQRKLDSVDSALAQIDKEVLAGRMTEQEAYPLKLKYEMNRLGVDAPTSLLPPGDEEERFGVRPYWMRGKEAAEGTPERQLYEAKIAEGISGQRTGTVPWDLDPRYIRTAAAEESRVNRGIFLEPEDIDEFLRTGKGQLPLDNKQLDVGIRVEGAVEKGVGDGRIRVISPEGQSGTILESELQEYRDRGFTVIGGTTESVPETIPPTTEDVVKQLESGEERFRKPSLKTFLTMSPLRTLMERRRAKRLVR